MENAWDAEYRRSQQSVVDNQSLAWRVHSSAHRTALAKHLRLLFWTIRDNLHIEIRFYHEIDMNVCMNSVWIRLKFPGGPGPRKVLKMLDFQAWEGPKVLKLLDPGKFRGGHGPPGLPSYPDTVMDGLLCVYWLRNHIRKLKTALWSKKRI